jgi:hypothetical protein
MIQTAAESPAASRLSTDTELSPAEMFGLYEKIVETRPGTSDAEIFEKIREWTFSDHTLSAHVFVGITKDQMSAWQKRNHINLSAGLIRPDPIDLARGHAWGQIRMANHANRIHSFTGPPAAHEVGL